MNQQNNYSYEEEKNIRDYVQIVFRRKWIIIATFIVTVVFATYHSSKSMHIYQATTQVKIDRENPNVLSFDEVMAIDSHDIIFYQTQYKILASRSLALRVINALNLKDNPEFEFKKKTKNFNIKRFLISLLNVKPNKPLKDKQNGDEWNSRIIDRYLSRLKIVPIKGSSLVNISFTGVNPNEIKKIVNMHAKEYIDSNLEVRFAASNDAVEWLQKQIKIKRELVEKAENTLQIYREKKKIISLEGRQNIVVQKLDDLNSKLTNSRTERMELETLYNQTNKYAGKQGRLETIPGIMKNTLILQLKSEYVNLLVEIKKLSLKYGKNHPAMIRAVTKAEELRTKMDEEVNKIAKSIEAKYKVALLQEESLFKTFEKQKDAALQLNRDAIAYGALKRDSEGERAMYEILLKRLKETDITGELQTSNIRIVDLAETPRVPIKPRKKKNVLLGAVLGLIMGICLAFFLEYLDDTIKKPEDVEQYLDIPLLGAIKKISTQASTTDLITQELPNSDTAEAIRSVRTRALCSIVDKHKKLIMVTSAVSGEGKTFIASNLAYAIAKTGKKTLLVDTDLREPRLDNIFDVARKPGLSDHLIGMSYLESIIKATSIPNLSVITSGIIPPNPSEILESTVMETFCQEVRNLFDIVIFDTPPCLIVTDAVALSRKMDGVIITIKSGSTVKDAVKMCISQLTSSNCEILGAITNFAAKERGSYYHSYNVCNDKYGHSNEKELRETESTSSFTGPRV